MRRIYVSFLGLGRKQPDGSYAYDPVIYELNGIRSQATAFVQAAEFEILGADRFDTAIIVDTEKSHQANFDALEKALHEFGETNIHPITIDEEMTAQGQWQWFEAILNCIELEDRLIVDLTHGYRSVPIIFSTALNFLQKARNIRIEAVYYGVFEKMEELGYAPIIDMKDFYSVNEWAEAVSRLVDDADASKLASVAENTPGFQFGDLNDPTIIKSMRRLTDTIKNIDANNVAEGANEAIEYIKKREKEASAPGKILLNLVVDKFVSLSCLTTPSGKYDRDYFRIQIALVRLLLEHRLFMQAYTIMREFIASLGMLEFEKEGMSNKKRKKRRKIHAEVFIRMVAVNENSWNFSGQEEIQKRMMPYYTKLEKNGIEKQLRGITATLTDYRNGFDHAWTSKSKAYDDIEEKGFLFLTKLEEILKSLDHEGLLI